MSEAVARRRTFRDFYPFYLTEHAHPVSRRLHVVGTGLALGLVGLGLAADRRLLWAAPLAGYGFAWIGHFRFEKNRPATFTHPVFSLMGDLRLFLEVVSGRRAW